MIPDLIQDFGSAYSTTENEFTGIYGCSKNSPYIPIWALGKDSKTQRITDKYGKKHLLWHHRLPYHRTTVIGKKYRNLYSGFKYYNLPWLWGNSYADYYVRKGMITDKDFNILVCVAVNANEYTTVNKQNPNPEQFITIVNNLLFTNSTHRLLKNRLKKDILDKTETDIIQTNNPNKYCMNIPKIIPNFTNFKEMFEHLNNLNELLCLKEKVELV